MKALQITIDGKLLGVYVPPEGKPFVARVGNIPRKFMRAHVMSGTDTESWQWQLPDLKDGQTISFRMVDAEPGSGVPPNVVRQIDPAEAAEVRRLAAAARARALREQEAQKGKASIPAKGRRKAKAK